MGALTSVLVTASPLLAQQDVAGGEDHPLISRYEGSVLVRYAQREFDEYVLPTGPVEGTAANARLTDSMVVEGKVTHLQYRTEGRSTLEVFRNYEMALQAAGFEVLFATQGSQFMDVGKWVNAFYDRHSGLTWASQRNPSMVGNEFRYLAARLERPVGAVYVSLYVTTRGDRNLTQLDVIETAPMEVGHVTVDADYLADELARAGFVALYGIQFATDAAEMTAESRPALDAIGELLQRNPELNLHVVGHTDNVGRYEYNLELSQRRAESVVQELVTRYDVTPGRLNPVGVGPVSPVATNQTEDGRAQNRRVELVIR